MLMRVAELADALGTEKRALDAIVRRLSVKQYEAPVAGAWTIKDMLGHIAVYADAERRALAAGVGRAREEPVYFEQIQPWNEEQYQFRHRWRPQRIVAELEENTARYLSLVKSLHEEDLIKHIRFPWNEQGTVHELVMESLKHQREHREQLTAAIDQPA
jgi:uncharacterized damage-inducible protein DinB